MHKFDIVIVANSPGELSALVRPTVERLHQREIQARIILVLTPCQFATGQELEVAKGFPGITEIIIPQEYRGWALRGIPPKGIKFNEKGIVVFMGGDLFHAVLISKKLKYPAIAYTQSHIKWENHYKNFLVPDTKTYDKFLDYGIKKSKLTIVGDLMVDGASPKLSKEEAIKTFNLTEEKPIITFMPGSRSFQINYMVPFFIQVAKTLNMLGGDLQCLFSLSPYISPTIIEKALTKNERIVSRNGKHYILGKDGIEILLIKNNQYDALNISELAVTIPGTNTAEVAALGVPMLVIFPMDKPDLIPMEGIYNYLCRIPFIKPLIKRLVVNYVNKKTKYFALPNIKADREIVPELRGKIPPSTLAKKIVELILDEERRKLMSKELKAVMGGRGAADKVVDEILKTVKR